MKITDEDVRKLVVRIAAGYALAMTVLAGAVAALWGTIMYLNDDIKKDHKERIKETAAIFEELGELRGTIAETKRYGDRVLAEMNETILKINRANKENDADWTKL